MSFLLRNNRRNKNSNQVAAQRPAFGSDRRIIPEARNPSLLRNKNQQNISNVHTSFDYGNQVQVQRTAQVQRKSTSSTKHATVTPQQQDAGVITMSEVLEDLRVLETQQRDSQRKLANARITKDNRLQQQTALEVQLEQNKYANGELRAQIRQFRDFLSCGTRELGTRRLAGSRAGDDIKAFEQQLKRGLQAQRTNTSLVRKISSLIIGLQNKEEILQRLNAESKEKSVLLEKDSRDAKRTEENLRKSIQNEVSKAHKIADEVAHHRNKSSSLEDELLSAQSSEESTRLRVQAIDEELESEAKRHTDAIDDFQAQLKKYEQDTINFEFEQKEFAAEMEKLSKELLQQKGRVVAIQEKEGHAPSSYSTDFKEAVPALDKKKFSVILDKTQSSVNTKHSENEELRGKLDSIRANVKQSKEDAKKNRNQVTSLTESTQSVEATQKSRSERISSLQQELEKERSEVVELRKSSLELQEEYSKESAENTGRLAEIDEQIKRGQDTVESLSNQITAINDSEKTLSESFESESNDLNCRLKAKKEAIQALEIEGARTEDEENAGKEEHDQHRKTELKRIKEERLAHLDHLANLEIELFERKSTVRSKYHVLCCHISPFLLAGYPSLRKVAFQYDNSKTMEDQAQEALHSLTESLEAKIEATARARDSREKEKREAIRKAVEAAAAVQRKEELRRENRKKRLAEIKRQEETERSRNEAIIDTLLAEAEEKGDDETFLNSKRGNGSSLGSRSKKRSLKKRKDADFYDPVDESALPHSDISPAEPKLLFPKYEDEDLTLSPYSSTYGTQNSEKRVHWRDQNRVSDSPAEASVKSRSKPSFRRARKYGSSVQSNSLASTTASTSRTSRPSKSGTTRTSPKMDLYDLLNSESNEDTESKRSTLTKTSASRTSRSSKSSTIRASSKLDDYDDLLNSESIDGGTSLRSISTKDSASRTSRSSKSDATRTSAKLDHYDDLLNSESNEDVSRTSRSSKMDTSEDHPSDDSTEGLQSKPAEKKTSRRRSISSKREEKLKYGLKSTATTDELDEYLPSKGKEVHTSEDHLLDESTGGVQSKPVEKQTYRRRSISSKRDEKSHFDSLMAMPDASSRSSTAKRRKRKKSSTDPRSRDDVASIELELEERPKKKYREKNRSPHRNEMDVNATLESGSKSRTKTKKYGAVKSNDQTVKKGSKDRKNEHNSRSKSSAYHFGDEDIVKSRSKDKKEGSGKKVSHRRRSVDKPRTTSSSLQPIDTETVKSQSSRGSRGIIKAKGSDLGTGRSISSNSNAKRFKEVPTAFRASSTGSRSRKLPTGSKKNEGQKKRKLSSISTSQVSDATGRSQQARRRKKQAAISKTSSKSTTEGSYDFRF
ncbi:MAG: hypothetical protein SGBAC_002125 [Bacillariaceae sp.]